MIKIQNEDHRTFLNRMGYTRAETKYSKLIADIFHTYPNIFIKFCEKCGITLDDFYGRPKVITEKSCGNKDRRIDIFIKTDNDVIIIENKIDAGETKGQLADYIKWAELTFVGLNKYYILLSPTYNNKISSQNKNGWIEISYKDLVSIIDEEPIMDRTVKEFVDTIKNYIEDFSDSEQSSQFERYFKESINKLKDSNFIIKKSNSKEDYYIGYKGISPDSLQIRLSVKDYQNVIVSKIIDADYFELSCFINGITPKEVDRYIQSKMLDEVEIKRNNFESFQKSIEYLISEIKYIFETYLYHYIENGECNEIKSQYVSTNNFITFFDRLKPLLHAPRNGTPKKGYLAIMTLNDRKSKICEIELCATSNQFSFQLKNSGQSYLWDILENEKENIAASTNTQILSNYDERIRFLIKNNLDITNCTDKEIEYFVRKTNELIDCVKEIIINNKI